MNWECFREGRMKKKKYAASFERRILGMYATEL